ncbi:Ger(x)C family spore germination protein [Halobacillus fulvus]|nr:Ger(x)C family spore germination protein [Halobacillus fulvus]
MKKLILVLSTLLLLTGCWDERQFKNIKLVLTLGYDQGENGGIIETVSIPTIQRSSEGPGPESVQVISTDAVTPRDARDKVDQSISNTFDPAKVKVVVIGEDLAKENIYPTLDEFYRNPNNNLNAHLALARGKAEDILNFNSQSPTRISDYISGILEGAVAATHATGENLQLVCAELIEPGEDFSIPMLKIDEEQSVIKFDGMGLFHEDHYTGIDIPADQTTLFMLMQGKKGRVARLTKKVSDKHENEQMNYVTVNVMNQKQKLKIKAEGETVSADLKVDLKVRVVEYPADHLAESATVKELNQKLSEILTKEAEEIIKIMQEANSDIWAIGRQVKAYHPEVHKKLDWIEAYPEIEITPNVDVEILQHGIIN